MTTQSLMTAKEYGEALQAQGLPRHYTAVVCPRCGTAQTAHDFIRAGVGKNVAEVAEHLGTSCIGRFTGAPVARKPPDGEPCNWTLDGMLQLHDFAVMEDGVAYPMFAPATPDMAKAHKRASDIKDGLDPDRVYGSDDFFRDAAELDLKASDLVPALAQRPEFADCLPQSGN